MIDMTTLSQALKIFYLPAIIEQMNYNTNAFYASIEANSEEVFGSNIKMAMKYGRTGGVGNRLETSELPNPGNRKITQVEYETKNIFGRVMITDKMMKVGQTNKGAFVNVLQSNLDDTLVDAKDQFGRQLFGDGVGKLATCEAAAGVNTITVDSVQYLCEGLKIDIMAVDNTVKVAEREITSVDPVNKTITIDGEVVTTLATDYICISGNYNLELTGLDAIFKTTGKLYNIERATNKWLTPNIIPVGGELDELDIQNGIDTADLRAGSKTDFLLAAYGVARAYQYLMSSLRSNIEIMELKGGFKTMSYNGIPLDKDKYCQAGRMYQLEKSNFKLHQIGDWDWMDRDGAVLSRVAGKAAYEAVLVKYGDLGCRKPAGQTVLTGITEH